MVCRRRHVWSGWIDLFSLFLCVCVCVCVWPHVMASHLRILFDVSRQPLDANIPNGSDNTPTPTCDTSTPHSPGPLLMDVWMCGWMCVCVCQDQPADVATEHPPSAQPPATSPVPAVEPPVPHTAVTATESDTDAPVAHLPAAHFGTARYVVTPDLPRSAATRSGPCHVGACGD